MSYTTGSQSLQKSMNGIFSIEGDTITAITILADDIACDTLTVNSTSTFNGSVPTSTVTGIPSLTQIAPVAMLNNLYLAAVAGGYARLSTIANIFTNDNTFQGSLISTTTQPVTTDSSTIVPTTNWVQDLLFTKIRVNTNNSVSSGVSAGSISQGADAVALGNLSGENMQGLKSVALGFSAGRTTQGASSVAIGPLAGLTAQGDGCVAIGNQTARLNQSDFSVALGQQAGYNALATNAIAIGYLSAYTSSIANSICFNGTGAVFNPTQAGLFVKPMRGVNTGLIAGGLFYDSSTGELQYSTSTTNTLNASVATTISSPTTNINGTTCNISSTNFAVSTSTATTFVNLPSTTTTFITATANQFITKNIADNLYVGAIAGGYAALTSNNTFTNTNLFTVYCPSSQVDPTALDVTGIVNWRTLLAQIAAYWTIHKASINTWTASNTFNMNISTLLPINYTWGSAQTYGVNSVGNNLNNQTSLVANTGSTGVYKTSASILFPSSAYGMYLVFYKVLLNAAVATTIDIGIGTTLAVPLTQSIITSRASAAVTNYCVMTSMFYANTAFSQPIYGVIKSTVLNTAITSVDIRYVRVG